MSKIQKEQQISRMPLSDWDIFPWTKEMYDRHQNDFQTILREYDEIKHKYEGDLSMARYRWIESKGGLLMKLDKYGILLPNVIEEKYQHFSNMLERFDDWLSFKEKRETTPEERKAKISEMVKGGMASINFGIPESIMKGVERDVQYEEEKVDEITQSALEHFQ